MRAGRAPLRPPALRPGDRIGITAPAGPVREEALRRGMEYLRARGYVPVPGENLMARHGYLAGDDARRLADLNRLLADESVRAVWSARGGYGSARIVEQVDLRPLRRRPKVLIGYSDVTVLHAAAYRTLRLPTFYGPNVSDLGDLASFDEPSLWHALEGTDSTFEPPLSAATVMRAGAAGGVLLGGCLSLLVSLIGTPFQVPTDGAILFWEEVGEEPYRIDRMLGQLRQAGCLARIRGMIVGQTAGCRAKDPLNDLPLEEILERHLRGRRMPVVLGVPAGHGAGKITLPLGRRVRLETLEGRPRISGR